jgi:hypothetical protein
MTMRDAGAWKPGSMLDRLKIAANENPVMKFNKMKEGDGPCI